MKHIFYSREDDLHCTCCVVLSSCLVLSRPSPSKVGFVWERKQKLFMVSVLKLTHHDMLFGDDIGTLLSCWLKQCLVGSKEHTTRADYQGSMLCSAVPSSYRRPNNPAWAEPCPQWRGLTMFQVEWSDEMVTLCAARHCWPNTACVFMSTPTRTYAYMRRHADRKRPAKLCASKQLDDAKTGGGGGIEKYQLLLLLLIRLERRIRNRKVVQKSCTEKLYTKVIHKSYT